MAYLRSENHPFAQERRTTNLVLIPSATMLEVAGDRFGDVYLRRLVWLGLTSTGDSLSPLNTTLLYCFCLLVCSPALWRIFDGTDSDTTRYR